MSTVLILGGVPALAALVAFMLMERPGWWGAAGVVALLAVGIVVPVALYLAAIVAVGWIAALIGTAMLVDESMVAAVVYFAVSTVWILIWVLVPDGTF
ncbi:MAG: hypothetical protein AAFZ99_11235 [Pseudomonadota bacterium]